jgi:hypothetical protein
MTWCQEHTTVTTARQRTKDSGHRPWPVSLHSQSDTHFSEGLLALILHVFPNPYYAHIVPTFAVYPALANGSHTWRSAPAS